MSGTPEEEEQELWKTLERDHALSVDLQEEILRIYGERGRKAVLAVDESRVKRYLDFFVVVGTSDEYVVEDEFCTCRAQAFRGGSCWACTGSTDRGTNRPVPKRSMNGTRTH